MIPEGSPSITALAARVFNQLLDDAILPVLYFLRHDVSLDQIETHL